MLSDTMRPDTRAMQHPHSQLSGVGDTVFRAAHAPCCLLEPPYITSYHAKQSAGMCCAAVYYVQKGCHIIKTSGLWPRPGWRVGRARRAVSQLPYKGFLKGSIGKEGVLGRQDFEAKLAEEEEKASPPQPEPAQAGTPGMAPPSQGDQGDDEEAESSDDAASAAQAEWEVSLIRNGNLEQNAREGGTRYGIVRVG